MKINTDPKKIEEVLKRGVVEVIERKHLKKELLSGKKLTIKYGIDPTKPDIHLGHTIPLRKVEEFQKLGHRVVLIIGDFTAQIGDPSGRMKARTLLSAKQAEENAKTYLEQANKIIDLSNIEVKKNSQWYNQMRLKDIIKLTQLFTVARILERDDFEKRLRQNLDVHLHEIIYPILQGYDSVVINADVEIGGTDQKFNMLTGRKLQKRLKKSQQDVITLPLLVGIDGKLKMSKTFGNYIGISEKPEEQYGKIMSIPDRLIGDYFELCTRVPMEKVQEIKTGLKTGKINPREAKARLAQEIVSMYHSKEAAQKAAQEFERIFKEKKLPTKIPEIKVKEKFLPLLDLLVKTKLASSKSEAKRLILQKGVKIDGALQKDWQKSVQIEKGMVIQVGKRRFAKLI